MKFFLLVISLLTLLNCSGKKGETRSIGADTVTANAQRTQSGADSASTDPGKRSVAPDTWTYEKTVDKTGITVHKASVPSANVVQFDYPYAGGSRATLTIREKDGSTQAYVEVPNGQFNRSFQNGSARIRFDGKPPVTYALLAAANGRANIVFFDSERRLINQIKAARTTSVQVVFEGQPVRQIEFRTANLRWNH